MSTTLNNIIWIVFDSARYDAFVAAATPAIDRIGPAERRFSYASWTAPSHYAYLMGLPPHRNETGRLAADIHREELALWRHRIGGDNDRDISFADFAPSLSLPAFLKRLGYRTEAYVSMPVLNPQTPIARHFDRYDLMPTHNDLAAIIERLTFDDQPAFFFVNTGETHYPYVLPHERPNDLPRLSGLHGVWRDLDDFLRQPVATIRTDEGTKFGESISIETERLRPLWRKQVSCIEYLDDVISKLIDKAPTNTWFIITADHGELFGEGGFFGHGPVVHEKVFEVFFVEGINPKRAAVVEEENRDEREVIMSRLRHLGYA